MKLEEASLNPPKDLNDFLVNLGDGENGFGGTPVYSGKATLREFLQSCCNGTDESKLKPGRVPQTVFWVLDSEERVVGMVRVRHRLAESTRINGGHIGFFIRPSHRGRGYGTQALALALEELKKIGESRALVTMYPENIGSKRIVETNGGQFADTVLDPRTEHRINRYWIDLGS